MILGSHRVSGGLHALCLRRESRPEGDNRHPGLKDWRLKSSAYQISNFARPGQPILRLISSHWLVASGGRV